MESKPKLNGVFSFLEFIMDMAGLNVLFLLFSAPIITVGAAQTALYAGIRATIKKEPCFRAFFKTFKGSFWRATAVWILLLIPTIPMLKSTLDFLYYRVDGYLPILLLSLGVSLVLMSILFMTFLLYSRFECTLGQLFKFSAVLTVNHFWRALLITGMLCLPFTVALWVPRLFWLLLPVWLFFYFAVAAVIAVWLMNRPFARFAGEILGDSEPAGSGENEPETRD